MVLLLTAICGMVYAQEPGSGSETTAIPASATTETPGSAFDWNALFPEGLIDIDGKNVNMDVLKDKIVGIYFSAHWCPPCRAFSPKLVEFRNKNSKDFEVVFVSFDKSEEAMKEYMTELKMEWPALKLKSASANAIAEKYNEEGLIPTLIILNRKGEIISGNGREDVQSNAEACLDEWKAKTTEK